MGMVAFALLSGARGLALKRLDVIIASVRGIDGGVGLLMRVERGGHQHVGKPPVYAPYRPQHHILRSHDAYALAVVPGLARVFGLYPL